MTPTHLVTTPGDRLTICGIRTDGVSRMSLAAAPTHRYEHAMCPECYATLPEHVARWGTDGGELPGQLGMFGEVGS